MISQQSQQKFPSLFDLLALHKYIYNRIFQKLFKSMKLQILLFLMVYSVIPTSSVCQEGSILNYERTCINPHYIEGCHIYQSQIRCHSCKYGFYLTADGLCSINKDKNGTCCQLKSITSAACLECSQGLFLSAGSCTQISIWGCVQQDQDGACLACGAEFYLKNGKCQKGILNCIQYTKGSLTVCSRCMVGFTLFYNECLPNKILGCKSQVNGQCGQCYPPFQLNSNKCEVVNCKSHNDFGCTACDCGYFLTDKNKCSQVGQGCIRYQRGKCTDCMNQFKLKGGACQIQGCAELQGAVCTRCKKGYELNNLGCKMQNCIDWLNGECLICEKGFHYIQGSCIKQVQIASS